MSTLLADDSAAIKARLDEIEAEKAKIRAEAPIEPIEPDTQAQALFTHLWGGHDDLPAFKIRT